MISFVIEMITVLQVQSVSISHIVTSFSTMPHCKEDGRITIEPIERQIPGLPKGYQPLSKIWVHSVHWVAKARMG